MTTGKSIAMRPTPWVLSVSVAAFAWFAPIQELGASDSVDVRARPMDWITPGTVIGEKAPKGWTDLVLIATPRLGVGDVNEISSTAASYSSLFRFTVLANTRAEKSGDEPGYVLDKVAIGLALDVKGRNVIANAENTFEADLGFLGRRILAENEKILKEDVRQVARTAHMVVFDIVGYVRRDEKHRSMVIRHAILASPTTGQVSSFAWLLALDGSGGHALADKGLQKLPTPFREDRVLSVDAQRLTLGIPSADAFALAKIPQGTPLGFSPALKAVAAVKPFTTQAAQQLEAELLARYAPVPDRAQAAAKVSK